MELFTPEFGLMFWMFVAVVLLLIILGKFAWPAIIKSLEERADLIDKGIEYAENAKVQLDNARAEAEKYVAEAKSQQAEILREADHIKSQMIEQAKDAAQVEAKKVMEAAQVAIEQSRKEAEMQFRKEVSAFALQVAEKLMREKLKTDAAQSELVSKLIDEVETKN